MPFPTSAGASGIWNMRDAFRALAGGDWPAAVVPLLLDLLSATPTGAYATWKLRTAYAGNCKLVRRSGDNATQAFGFAGSGLLDTTALVSWVVAGGGTQGGFVVTDYDQSGNGRDLTQATAGNQPQIVSAGALIATINGLPSLQFDGVSDQLSYGTLDDFCNAGAYSMMALARPTAGGTNNDQTAAGKPQLFGDSGGNLSFRFGSSRLQMKHYHAFNYVASVGSLTYPQTLVAQGSYDGTNIKARVDGGSAASTAAGTIDAMTSTADLGHGSGAGLAFAGTCAAFLAFDSAISLTDINTIGAELASKGGTTWSTAV